MPLSVARVAVNRPLREPLDYTVPEDLLDRVQVGVRVLVPLRRETATGVVVQLADSSDFPSLKPVKDVLDDAPVLDATMLKLTQWIGDYYCCSWGEAIAAAAPPGGKWKITTQFQLADPLPIPFDQLLASYETAPRQARVLQFLQENGAASARQIGEATGGSSAHAMLRSLLDAGCVAEVAPGQSVISQPRELLAVEPLHEPTSLLEQSESMQRAPRQVAVLHALAARPEQWLASELIAATSTSHATLRSLEDKALIRLTTVTQDRLPGSVDEILRGATSVELTDEQDAAVNRITTLQEAGTFAACVLEGITGSGKTEVYLHAAEQALAADRDVIVLVPEISLTTQVVARFQGRFGDTVAVLHSKLSAGQRGDQWRALQTRRMRIAIGARSAIFAPLPDVGLIIVDEEHENAYKQQDTPKYHARDVAVMRGHLSNAVVVLGSATPSLETLRNVQSDKYEGLRLHKRATGALLPTIEVVDLREALRGIRQERSLSDTMLNAIGEALDRNQQTIMFLNRRGYAPALLCTGCGLAQGCDHCSVSMIWHRNDQRIRCHLCQAERAVPSVCAYCKAERLIPIGAGTQKIEQELVSHFPNARIARMDADTTSRKGAHNRILTAMGRGEIDILLGTQMVAKGLDFPNVALVGVVEVDTALNLPDLRAIERTGQQLTQVAGRSGRGESGGHVIFQTYRPDHYAVLAAVEHDYRSFAEQELAMREELEYPPFRHLARVVCEGPDQAAVIREINRIVGALDRHAVQRLGPAPAPFSKIQNRFRWHCQLLSPNTAVLRHALNAVRDIGGKGTNGVRTTVDMDAYDLL